MVIWIEDKIKRILFKHRLNVVIYILQQMLEKIMINSKQVGAGMINLKKRYNLSNIKIFEESASADHKSTTTFPQQMKTIIEDSGYVPEYHLNVDETGLFCKKRQRGSTINVYKCYWTLHDKTNVCSPFLKSSGVASCRQKKPSSVLEIQLLAWLSVLSFSDWIRSVLS